MKPAFYILTNPLASKARLRRSLATAAWIDAKVEIMDGPTDVADCQDYPAQIGDIAPRPGNDSAIGEICCAQGHLTIWKAFLESEATHAVVVEDDTLYQLPFESLKDALFDLPTDAHWAILHSFGKEWVDWDPARGQTDWWDEAKPQHTVCTAAYVMTRAGAEVLRDLPITEAIDMHLQTLSKTKNCFQCRHGILNPDFEIPSQITAPPVVNPRPIMKQPQDEMRNKNPLEDQATEVEVTHEAKKLFRIGSEGCGHWGEVIWNYLMRLAYPEDQYRFEISSGFADECRLLVVGGFMEVQGEFPRMDLPYLCWSGEKDPVRPRFAHKPLANFCTAYHDDTTWLPMSALLEFNARSPRPIISLRPHELAYCSGGDTFRDEMFLAMARQGLEAHALGDNSLNKNRTIFKDTNPLHLFKRPNPPGQWGQVHKAYQDYKAVLCMENTIAPGYVTEKLMTVFQSGAIPLYWGDAEAAAKVFNKDAFVDLRLISARENVDDIAKWVNAFLKTPDVLQSMAEAPFFANDETPDEFAMWDETKPTPPMWADLAKAIREACGD